MDAARRRLQEENCIRTERIRSAIEKGYFVVVSAPANVQEPFYIAQVLENDAENNQFTIQWYEPSARSKERTTNYHQHSFREQNIEVQVRNQQAGARRARLDRWTQVIQYNAVHFGFNKLRETGGLPAEVLRLLRSVGLVDGTIRRT
jgi:hypothetical protein